MTEPLTQPSTPEPQTTDQTNRRSLLKYAAGACAAGAAMGAVGVREAFANGSDHNSGGGGLPNLYRGWNSRQFNAIRNDEDTHVAFLVKALGEHARPKPTFVNLRQKNIVAFGKLAKALENTGTGAYLGALPHIASREYVAAAGSIALIEARHSGYLDVLFNLESTTNVFGEVQEFERPLTIAEVVASAGPFVVSLNDSGNFPLTFSTDPADLGPANDLKILNFALALEYLEKEFYDVNVPRFFR